MLKLGRLWIGIGAWACVVSSGCAIYWGDGDDGPDTWDEDDGVDDDSDEAPEPDPYEGVKIVFVTSNEYPADLAGFGDDPDPLAVADQLCELAADAASLRGSYHAWLSTAAQPAVDRIQTDGPWVGVDGAMVFPNRASLSIGPESRLGLDERGHFVVGDAWTGTNELGLPTLSTCEDWTEASIDAGATAGTIGGMGGEWTDSWELPCSWEAHLICFER